MDLILWVSTIYGTRWTAKAMRAPAVMMAVEWSQSKPKDGEDIARGTRGEARTFMGYIKLVWAWTAPNEILSRPSREGIRRRHQTMGLLNRRIWSVNSASVERWGRIGGHAPGVVLHIVCTAG